MDLSFANPAGFLALLALPVVLGIHFFQRQSQRVVTSTLFLFDALNPVSAEGRRLDRLRNSLPLWLQLAAVVLLAWLLAGPRWLRRDSSLRVVVVVDSSVSMLAFRDELGRTVPARLRSLARTAAKTEWLLLETDPAQPTLYAGTELTGLLAALDRWTPHLGTHDFAPALNAARGLVREPGIAMFVTDRKSDVPDGVETLAIGHPVDNCGWVGVTVEGDRWRALVQNHSATPQTRTWHLEAGGTVGVDESLTLAPGQIRTLAGAFPAGQDRCELVLTADKFSLDDRLPLVRPEPKRISLSVGGGKELEELLRRLAGSVPNAEIVDASRTADVRLDGFAPEGELHTNATHAILFAPPGPPSATYLSGEPLAENVPLTAGLIWSGLLCKQTDPIPPQPGDETLVWQGERPLILLRHSAGSARALCVNFDVLQSNVDRLPAFVVLVNRFVEMVRGEKAAFERLNVETNQPLNVVAFLDGGPMPAAEGGVFRAPFKPDFFQIKQGDRTLLDAAAHFADSRQADFKAAASFDTLEGKTSAMRGRNSREDFLWPFFALALGAILLANWAATGQRREASPTFARGGSPG